MNNFIEIQHASLIVSNTVNALEFYCGTLGMVQAERPDLGFPGAWLKIGQQQLHLLEVPNPDPVEGRPSHGGRDRHTAIQVRELAPVIECLEGRGIEYTKSRSGRDAIFVRDPDGNVLELMQ